MHLTTREGSARVLMAEDDLVSRKLLAASLKKWGYEPVVTCDGSEALEAFHADGSIQMAVLDWMMPGMEGPDVCRRIKEAKDRPFTYVIMLTALTEKRDIVKALSTGADDHLAKPWDATELEARINAGFRVVDLETSLRSKINDLKRALDHVKQLQGILPICAWCHKIRDDSDYWHSVEEYFERFSEAQFSHSICPDCLKARSADD